MGVYEQCSLHCPQAGGVASGKYKCRGPLTLTNHPPAEQWFSKCGPQLLRVPKTLFKSVQGQNHFVHDTSLYLPCSELTILMEQPRWVQPLEPGRPHRVGQWTQPLSLCPAPPRTRSKNMHFTEQCLWCRKTTTSLNPDHWVHVFLYFVVCTHSPPLRLEFSGLSKTALVWPLELSAEPAASSQAPIFYLEYYNYSNLDTWQTFSQKEQSEPVTARTSDSICCW